MPGGLVGLGLAPVARPHENAAEPPGGRDFCDALCNMGDLMSFHPETPERQLENGRVRLVAPRSLRRDDAIEEDTELRHGGLEQVVVNVGDYSEPVARLESA